MARAGEVHRHAGRLAGRDDLGVTDRATGLDDGLDPGVDEDLRAVGEGEEGVGGGDRRRRPLARPLDGADLLLVESPTNPMLEVADLPAVLGAARAAGPWQGRDR